MSEDLLKNESWNKEPMVFGSWEWTPSIGRKVGIPRGILASHPGMALMNAPFQGILGTKQTFLPTHSELKCQISSIFFLWWNIDEKFHFLVPLALLGIKDSRKHIKGQQRSPRPYQRPEGPTWIKKYFFGVFGSIRCQRCHDFHILLFQVHKGQKGR